MAVLAIDEQLIPIKDAKLRTKAYASVQVRAPDCNLLKEDDKPLPMNYHRIEAELDVNKLNNGNKKATSSRQSKLKISEKYTKRYTRIKPKAVND